MLSEAFSVQPDKQSFQLRTYEEMEGVLALLPSTQVSKDLLEQFENTEDAGEWEVIYGKAHALLEKRAVLEKRQFQPVTNEEEKVYQETSLIDIRGILENVCKQDYSIGDGTSAAVFADPRYPDYCYKVINNRQLYKKINSVGQESNFLSDLADLEVEGARVCLPYYYAAHPEFQILVMERIKGMTVDALLNGSALPPAGFVVTDFLRTLEKYVAAMHERRIYHRDLSRQNVMIDSLTCKPRIIDFGKSIKLITDEDPYLFQDTSTNESFNYLNDVGQLYLMRKAMLAKFNKK